VKINGCSALVTGASAGIGREFARQLAGRAGTVILVARRGDRLQELRGELTRRHPNLSVHVRVTDLADRLQIYALVEWLERQKIRVDLLINNAGLGDVGPFATSEPERIERIMLVNMVAPTLLTRRLVPAMLRRKSGGILNVSSAAGFLPIPNFSTYAASKAYLTSFSEALRAELRGTGVSVCALCPGPVHTEFDQVAQRPSCSARTSPQFVYVSAETIARLGLAAIESDRALLIPGFTMNLGMFFVRLSPMWMLRPVLAFSARRR
jgi:short-subunit dehydrogenase